MNRDTPTDPVAVAAAESGTLRPVPFTRLLRLWLPLQATWLMMAVEGPFLAAVIARLADPAQNLAAYGVAFALAVLVEAPVIMMTSASAALVDGAAGYRRLRTYALLLNAGVTAAMLLLVATPLWDLVALRAMALPAETARLARTALVILLPWPAAIGYRRFCQGLLIRAELTRRVAWGTAIRLTAMTGTALLCRGATDWPGAWIGAAALSGGVMAEAVASRVMVAGTIRALLGRAGSEPLGLGAMHRFYLPLALTSTIALAVQPLVTFFMGQARHPLESLAVLPVINSLVFLFRTPGLSYQELAVTMLGRGPAQRPAVRGFAVALAAAAAAGLGMIVLTPLLDFWLQGVSGLAPGLARYAETPLRILVLMPALSVMLSWQRAVRVASRRTGPVTWASALEVAGIAVVLTVTVRAGWTGATAAAAAFMAGRLAANIFLLRGERPRKFS